MIRTNLRQRIRKKSTALVGYVPQDCPSCGCPRFGEIPLNMVDKALGRAARYRCDKCGEHALLEESETPPGDAIAEPSDFTELQPPEQSFLLGVQYLQGRGVDKSESAAFACFERAAGMNHSNAQYNLGLQLVRGMGVGQDLVRGYYWLAKAAENGHEKAIFAAPRVARMLNVDQLEQLRIGAELHERA
ncbi:MAG: tetratricopeptide repeat protein [Pseudomonadota bacterium]